MVKVTGPMFSLEAHGSLKDTLTYQRRPKGSSVYAHTAPKVPLSGAQVWQREKIGILVRWWQSLSDAQKAVWESRAKGKGQSGYSYFISQQKDWMLDPSLVIYLPFWSESLKGDSLTSKDSYGHLCTVTDALWTPDGRYFDGEDDWINCGNPTNLQFASADAFSIFAWINPNLLDYRVILSKMEIAGAFTGYMFVIGSLGGNQLEVVLRKTVTTDNIFVHSDDAIIADARTQVGFTYDGSLTAAGVILYRDGEVLASSTHQDNLTGEILNTVEDVLIGVRGTEKDYKGYIPEIWFDNRALTPQEIQHNYLATKWR